MNPPLVFTLSEPKMEPSGLRIETVLELIVTPVILRLTRWPTNPSKRTIATLLAVVIVTVLLSPIAIWLNTSTSAAVNGEGGIKK